MAFLGEPLGAQAHVISTEELAKDWIEDYKKVNASHTAAQDSDPEDPRLVARLEDRLDSLAESIKKVGEECPSVKAFEDYPFKD